MTVPIAPSKLIEAAKATKFDWVAFVNPEPGEYTARAYVRRISLRNVLAAMPEQFAADLDFRQADARLVLRVDRGYLSIVLPYAMEGRRQYAHSVRTWKARQGSNTTPIPPLAKPTKSTEAFAVQV